MCEHLHRCTRKDFWKLTHWALTVPTPASLPWINKPMASAPSSPAHAPSSPAKSERHHAHMADSLPWITTKTSGKAACPSWVAWVHHHSDISLRSHKFRPVYYCGTQSHNLKTVWIREFHCDGLSMLAAWAGRFCTSAHLCWLHFQTFDKRHGMLCQNAVEKQNTLYLISLLLWYLCSRDNLIIKSELVLFRMGCSMMIAYFLFIWL